MLVFQNHTIPKLIKIKHLYGFVKESPIYHRKFFGSRKYDVNF